VATTLEAVTPTTSTEALLKETLVTPPPNPTPVESFELEKRLKVCHYLPAQFASQLVPNALLNRSVLAGSLSN
jgi:hypothetical protein